jgi:hypothetical protein
MSDDGISKLDAARHQLDRAIRLLLDQNDSICADTLSYAAYRVLREKLDLDRAQLMERLEEALKVGKVSCFLKHAKHDPDAVLDKHSPETVHITIALAIMLWKEHGQEETAAMKEFSALPDPYEPEYRHSSAIRMTEVTETSIEHIINKPST